MNSHFTCTGPNDANPRQEDGDNDGVGDVRLTTS